MGLTLYAFRSTVLVYALIYESSLLEEWQRRIWIDVEPFQCLNVAQDNVQVASLILLYDGRIHLAHHKPSKPLRRSK